MDDCGSCVQDSSDKYYSYIVKYQTIWQHLAVFLNCWIAVQLHNHLMIEKDNEMLQNNWCFCSTLFHLSNNIHVHPSLWWPPSPYKQPMADVPFPLWRKFLELCKFGITFFFPYHANKMRGCPSLWCQEDESMSRQQISSSCHDSKL